MRKLDLVVAIILATALGVGVTVRSWPDPTRASHPTSDHARISETGALYRFPPEAAARSKLDAAPALSLTSSDGTGLKLASLDARGVVQGPLAFTELRLAFDNPDDRTLEGTFRITLPQGAAVSRFAMRQGDRWQEGEVVEQQAARRAYEDFLHRRQDPALLEQAAGNEFSARVFPIPARGRKELIVSYSQQITPEAPYTVPLRGLPQVGKLDAVVTRTGDDAPLLGQVHLENAAPERDLVVEASKLPAGDGVRAGDLVLLRVKPAAEAGQDPVKSAVILVDTSASRALGFEAQIELVAKTIAGFDPATPLVVAAFDQGIDVIHEGPASGFTHQGAARLRERQAMGASDLEGALAWARSRARASGSKRVIVVTDGVPTAGPTDAAALREAAASLKSAGVERLDALAVGGIRDDATLRSLCSSGLARSGVVVDGARGPEQAVRRLTSATRSVDVKVEGADWQWPERLEGFQPGDEALVYAKLNPGAVPRLSMGGAPVEMKLTEVDRPLLERAWVSAKIAQLVQKPPAGQSEMAVHNEIVRLSTSFRVLSPYTSLLVLESEADYARYKIDRKALADILTVDGTKLARLHRSDDTAVGATQPPSDKKVQQADLPVLTPPAPPVVNPTPPPDDDASPRRAAQAAPPPPPQPLAAAAEREAPGEVEKKSAPPRAGGAVRAAPASEAAAISKQLAEMEQQVLGVTGSAPAPESIPNDNVPTGSLDAFAKSGAAAGGKGGLKVSVPGGGPVGLPGRLGLADIPPAGKAGGYGNSSSIVAPKAAVSGGGSVEDGQISNADRVLALARAKLRACYQAGLNSNPDMEGRVAFTMVVSPSGSVSSASATPSGSISPSVASCMKGALQGLSFEPPEGGRRATIRGAYNFINANKGSSPPSNPASPTPPSPPPTPPSPPPTPPPPPTPLPPPTPKLGPYEGPLAEVMAALDHGDRAEALARAITFRSQRPGDVMAFIALGEAFEALGETRSAARAYGSILDLFSSRADLRRMAGERLERLKVPYAQALAADSFAKAAQQRPDHPSSHRLLAFARLRAGDPAGAFDAIEAGAKRSYPSGRFAGVDRILREDMGLIAAAWLRVAPGKRDEIERRLGEARAKLEHEPSLRFVLTWETDANDVDFHIHDSNGGHAYYSQKQLPNNGGELYADVTTGYGPECFTIRKPPVVRAYPYRLQAHYYSRGPMGYGMGKLEVIDHDGEGTLTFEERPFVVMQDRAFVELGSYPSDTASDKR